MKRSKLGAISALIAVILGCLILLGGIGVITVGYTDVGGLWTKCIEPQAEVVNVLITQNPIIANNKYVTAIAEKTVIIWNKIPQEYRLGTFGGIIVLAGLGALLGGLACYRRKAKKSYLVFAVIETVIFSVLAGVVALLAIGGCELVILLSAIGTVLIYGILPTFKYFGYASYASRAKLIQKKVFTKVVLTPANGASHKSASKKKLTKKQKKLAKLAQQKSADVGVSGKVLSKPVNVTTAKLVPNHTAQVKSSSLDAKVREKLTMLNRTK